MSAFAVQVATPPVSAFASQPSIAKVSALKLTVPIVGVAVAGAAGLMVAVKVTDWSRPQ